MKPILLYFQSLKTTNHDFLILKNKKLSILLLQTYIQNLKIEILLKFLNKKFSKYYTFNLHFQTLKAFSLTIIFILLPYKFKILMIWLNWYNVSCTAKISSSNLDIIYWFVLELKTRSQLQ
jgi:hypothetical protein